MVQIDPATYNGWYRTPFGALCHRLERDALLSLTKFKPGERLLDAGCGTGVYLRELKDTGLSLHGMDHDPGMLRYVRGSTNLASVPLVRGRVEQIPFKDESFDKLLSVCTLEFVADISAAFREMARVLRNDGSLLAGFLNRNCAWARLRMEKAGDPSSVWHGVRFHMLSEIALAAGKSGLEIQGFRGAVYFLPEDRDMDISSLESAEVLGKSARPDEPAFIGALFIKQRR